MGERAEEETQRTRFFLYAAVAYAATVSLGLNEFTVFENGVTSLNIAKSQQLMNARNSRTTHPRTLADVCALLSLVNDGAFDIRNPFAQMTKAEVINLLVCNGGGELISSSVSCSRTFDDGVKEQRTHCGRCSQCIDRRMAIYAAGAENFDNESLYVRNFIHEDVDSGEARTTLLDYVRQAVTFHKKGIDAFYRTWLDDLSEILPYLTPDGCVQEVL
jgi:hypothetical protein